jgi:hypothetical protein
MKFKNTKVGISRNTLRQQIVKQIELHTVPITVKLIDQMLNIKLSFSGVKKSSIEWF